MKANLLLTVFVTLCFSVAQSQSANDPFSFSLETEDGKKAWLKKGNVVTIHPNPSYNGEVSITSKAEQSLHFYIFDLEGTLIYQAVLKTKEKKAITKLDKGTYLYSVFANDESIEEGKLIVK